MPDDAVSISVSSKCLSLSKRKRVFHMKKQIDYDLCIAPLYLIPIERQSKIAVLALLTMLRLAFFYRTMHFSYE